MPSAEQALRQPGKAALDQAGAAKGLSHQGAAGRADEPGGPRREGGERLARGPGQPEGSGGADCALWQAVAVTGGFSGKFASRGAHAQPEP